MLEYQNGVNGSGRNSIVVNIEAARIPWAQVCLTCLTETASRYGMESWLTTDYTDQWEYEYRYPEADDTTPRSSQLDLTGGPSDFSRSPTQGYSYASDMPRGYPPNPYQQGRALINAPYPRSGQPYDSGQPTSLSLRPANISYGRGYQGSSPGSLMTDSSGFPVGGPNTLVPTYPAGDDDDRNYGEPLHPRGCFRRR